MMPSVFDIFSGCGGLSLGAHQAGFTTSVAIDVDPLLSSSFGRNFPKTVLLRRDVRSLDKAALREILPKSVDGVVGGPPCQAFSEIGRRAPQDPRRDLVLEYFRIISILQPKFFVFENVRGLSFDRNVGLLDRGLALLGKNWRFIGPTILNAADFGAPTNRYRLFVFGFNTDVMKVPDADALCATTAKRITVRDAIADLSGAGSLGDDAAGFDHWKYDHRRTASDYAMQRRNKSGKFTSHRRTEHTKETLKRFAKLEPGKTDKIGKYRRLDWDGLCVTLRAGTGNDKGSYQAVRPIHPEEDRVITAREAARLQGFPDSFIFHPTVWHSCRMIGNSVSPVIAKALLRRINKHLSKDSAGDTILAAE